MDPCGGPVDMYSQTGDWAPESPMAAIKVIFEGPLVPKSNKEATGLNSRGQCLRDLRLMHFMGEK